ncbi:hypothetical protein GCM10009119_02000 [Algoriphagus jejuensis]|uniref:Endoglucanase n=1 Tax=Algoriphagus jejuensis TaxID=419934 RepID=A0ABN1MW95_9BACT
MNSLLKFPCSLFILSLILTSCGESLEDEPSQLQGSLTEIDVASKGGTQTLDVSGNVAWTISLNADWVHADPSQGQGDARVTFTIDSNSAESARNTEARLVGGGIVRTVRISQAKYVPEFPAYHIPADQSGMRDISSLALAAEMGVGWNLGNSLEAIGGESAWGNPVVTKAFVDEVKAAGFTSVRIPVAWSKFTNATNFTIDPTWMNRVQEVVDYAIGNGMYVLLNNHWDEGWMQPTFAQQVYVNDRLEKMWIQIALHFRDYDDHLLFAGSNEVMVDGDYGVPKPEYYTVQNSFNQTFVDAVRSTGGRNAYRNLVVQAFNTNIDNAVSFFEMPSDPTEDRLMVEVHYYDPYEFALKEDEVITQWGKDATDPAKTASSGGESFADGQLQKMKVNFIDKGVPVLLGEYCATDKKAEDNDIYREDFLRYISKSARGHGLVPFYWDNGFAGDYGSALFNRTTGEQIYPDLVKAVVE